MSKPRFLVLTVIFLGVTFLVAMTIPAGVGAQEAPRIAGEQVKATLGKPGVVIIDVRSQNDWNSSHEKILRAVREDPRQVASWASKFSKKSTLILYCS